MKRQTLIGLLIMVCCGIMAPSSYAQHYFYHNVGDTVFGRDTIYYYGWWVDDWIDPNDLTHEIGLDALSSGDFCNNGGTDSSSEILQYYYTNTPLEVIGLAFCGTGYWSDTMYMNEYVMLYDATPDSFSLKKKIEWHTWDPHRYYFSRQQAGGWPEFCTGNDVVNWDVMAPLHEYYFEDKPVIVCDSFYVGVTNNSFAHFFNPETQLPHMQFPGYYAWVPPPSVHNRCHWEPPQGSPYYNCPEVPTPRSIKRKHAYTNEWHYLETPVVLFVFPIIKIDTTALIPPDTTHYVCPEVQRLRFVGGQDGTVWLLWNENSTEHVSWQTSFGEAGFAPEAGFIDSVSGNPIGTLNGLDSCVRYEAYVRAVCTHDDSTYYSNWTGPVRIYLCDTTSMDDTTSTGPGDDTLVVASPGDLDRLTQLIPNPADREVRVVSSVGLQSVEVLDMKGQCLLRRETHDESTVIDVNHWASGVYIVVVRTPAGIATKKLVVAERP